MIERESRYWQRFLRSQAFLGIKMATKSQGPEEKTNISYIELLCDTEGHTFAIRPIQPSDKYELQKGLKELSLESLRYRFFEYKKEFSPQELKFLTEVDHDQHCALVLVELLNDKEKGIGVARFVRSKKDPTIAEFAITIHDNYHSKGLGKFLLNRLIHYAKDKGIKTVVGEVDCYNHKMISLLKNFPNFKLQNDKNQINQISLKLPLSLTSPSLLAVGSLENHSNKEAP